MDVHAALQSPNPISGDLYTQLLIYTSSSFTYTSINKTYCTTTSCTPSVSPRDSSMTYTFTFLLSLNLNHLPTHQNILTN